MGDTKRTNYHQRNCRWFGPFVSSPFLFLSRSAGFFCFAHLGILKEKWKKLAVLGNAIFSRFPNEKPEKPTLGKTFLYDLPIDRFATAFTKKVTARQGERPQTGFALSRGF
jgi:hypothetical protein